MNKSELEQRFDTIKCGRPYKELGNHNPVMTQRFGADPYVLVYEERCYLYMTGDIISRDKNGDICKNNYSNINTINVISSEDLVNWTDHGSIYAASKSGAATWGNNSWAPAAAYKIIDGSPKFFLYFANSGNGIAVLTSDSPTGPFIDPLGRPLISRDTPNCKDVTWLFDPAILMDDGIAYLYFGGGISDQQLFSNPGTARVVRLEEDMISLACEPRVIENVSYLFEDSGINKIGDTYYYSYCSNFNVPDEEVEILGFDKGEIIMMTSKNPMGPFQMYGSVLKNPGYFFGEGGNNHHCMFEFKGKWYMSYHTQLVEQEMKINKGYRSTNIDRVYLNNDGTVKKITGTKAGVEQECKLNPYQKTQAVTMGIMSDVTTTQYGEISEKYGSGDMIVTGIHSGSWIGIYGVDFGNRLGDKFTISIRTMEKTQGCIKICVDKLDSEAVGYVEIKEMESGIFQEITVSLDQNVTGCHDLFFIFEGQGYDLQYWFFD